MKGLLAVALLLVAAPAASAQYPNEIKPPTDFPGFSLVAGAYPEGEEGEGIPAVSAQLHGVLSLSWSDGSILISEGDRIRHVDPAGIIRTIEDDDVDRVTGIIGGPGGFVVADSGSDTVSMFSGLLGGGEQLVLDGGPDPFRPIDVAAGGAPILGGTWGSLWILDLDELGLVSHTFNGWGWDPVAEPWDAEGVGERTGGGVLYAERGGFGAEQDCRIYAVVSGGRTPVAGEGGCAGGGGLVGHGKPADQVRLSYPVDVEGTPDGGFVITEHERLSRVAPDGTYTVLFTAEVPDDLGPILLMDGLDVTDDGDVIFSWGDQVWRYDGNFTATTAPPVVNPSPNPNPQPPPPPGATTAVKPSAKLAKDAYKVKRGKQLKLKVTASAAGSYKLDVLRKGKRVKRKAGKVKPGANTIAFRARLKTGAYKLKLTLTTATGTATDTAALKIHR
jgi:hypothetical protein